MLYRVHSAAYVAMLNAYLFLQLICTVTPASSNSEETHNTLKFAHRSKHVEIKASQNKVTVNNN